MFNPNASLYFAYSSIRRRNRLKMYGSMKGKFRDSHSGIFEKSLRNDSTKSIATQQKAQWTQDHRNREKNADFLRKKSVTDSTGEEQTHVFYTHKIKKIMDEILEEKLSTQSYDPTICRLLCSSLSEDIKSRVKNLGMERFRLICSVSIGSISGQGILMASRFLWNECKDNFSTSSYQNSSLFAVAIVFGVLKEWLITDQDQELILKNSGGKLNSHCGNSVYR